MLAPFKINLLTVHLRAPKTACRIWPALKTYIWRSSHGCAFKARVSRELGPSLDVAINGLVYISTRPVILQGNEGNNLMSVLCDGRSDP